MILHGKTEVEEKLNAHFAECSVCKKLTKTGAKQVRMYRDESGRMIKVVAYMCPDCLKKGEPWPGVKPHSHMTNKEISKELDRIGQR
jgi:predicted anti-sigma-YlaC factor YlaD